MDDSEKIAYEYLKKCSYSKIVFEPNGQRTFPDFFLDDSIGVEVRRLNKNIELNGTIQCLEQAKISLLRLFRAILQDLSYLHADTTWYLSYEFQRPLQKWSELKEIIQSRLLDFHEAKKTKRKYKLSISDNLIVKLEVSKSQLSDFFELRGIHDRDYGGWLLEDLNENIQFAISEKTRKREKENLPYKKWYLILVDHIDYALKDRSQSLPISHTWDKVIVIDAMGSGRNYEV